MPPGVTGRPHTWTDEELAEAVSSSRSWGEVARKLGLKRVTGFLRGHGRGLALDTSHFPYRQGGRGALTEAERRKRHQAVHEARRTAFYASRGGVCERCGAEPYTAVWRDAGRESVSLQAILGWARERREAALPDLVVICYQCYLDHRHNGRPHGTLSRYGARGCRCDECLKGRADYEQARRMKRSGVSQRPRWKYGNVLMPTEETAHLWGVPDDEIPVPDSGWWTDLGRE